jgi:SAM-dependent methyltransferase
MAARRGHLERLRLAEAASVRDWLRPGMRVLELGGGDGFQASVLTAWGSRVVSVDLPDRPRRQPTFFPVLDYDGQHLPFAPGTFDAVFSSNVLEHIESLPQVLAETRRVLRPDGLAVHLVPSTAWRVWTSLAHYAYLLKRVAGGDAAIPGAMVPDAGVLVRRRGLGYLLRRALLAGPHGAHPSALAELYYFSGRRWRRVFERSGFAVVEAGTNGLFYTGYGLAPRRSLAARRRLAGWLGAACHLFVVRPVGRYENGQ